MTNYMQSFVFDPLKNMNTEETFLQDFLVIIKIIMTWTVLSAG